MAYLSNGSADSGCHDGCDSGSDESSEAELKLVLTTNPDKLPNPEKLMKKKERILNYISDFKIPENLFNDDAQGNILL